MAFLTGDHASGSDLSYMPSAVQSGESHTVYGPQMPSTDVYQTGGYWLTGTQMMNCVFSPTDHVADVAFDPLEELVWCISRLGQLTAFYSISLERYITTTIPLLPTDDTGTVGQFGELKQVYPSPRSAEHSVYVLASNALHAFTKFGHPFACVVDKLMVDLECLAVTGPTGATPGTGLGSTMWGGGSEADYSRLFVGGLQPTLLELDAQERWGEIIRATEVGLDGCVVLRSFSSGLCAGTTNGKVMVVDPRLQRGIVRELEAHTGEISDITVVPHGYTLVTCGWSRVADGGLRVDRLLKVYDLRSGRAQVPLSTSLDPCFTRFFPGCTDRLLAASQGGAFQLIQWGNRPFSPDDLGRLWPSYDRLVALDISQNGNCVVFGTETGHLQLYVRDMNMCQFNTAPKPTEFASPLAEGLWPTNSLNATPASAYPFMCMEDPANSVYGANLVSLTKTAAEAVELQLLAASLHQPAATAAIGNSRGSVEAFELVERRKVEAANEVALVAYKPVEYDDYRFSLASIPFAVNPPASSIVGEGDSSEPRNSLSQSDKRDQLTTSDWPEDLCQPYPRPMLPVSPDLIVGANRKRTARKPPHWGPVWYPYSDDPSDVINREEDTRLGRFVPACAEDNVATSG
ncbi:PAB-dependent poly(A)-specific ribonuclease subunit 2 [Paragonimus westermani]|uniref:PAB-dependent poly(A)-specific ribonuclease subunit 2 n=1 Tax=Paragonimus westermani TaxID=34504 RepID=A0A5J4NES8_9TREM|nr:PAB-dependent poly(A)-specific ribonuclease subunit 2 [Paragonimus westermani]